MPRQQSSLYGEREGEGSIPMVGGLIILPFVRMAK